jgi:hypothetical protein
VTFFCDVFLTSCLLAFSSQSIHAHQSEAHLGTKLMTFPKNVEKWQLRFRSRADIKIKLFRVCISRLFIIFWYVLSKPAIATLHRRHYSHYPQFMDPLGIPFETQICNILHFIFLMTFWPNIFFQMKSRWGICDTSGVRGELGGSRRFPETPGRQRAPGSSKQQKTMPFSTARMQKCYYNVSVTLCFWRSDHQVLSITSENAPQQRQWIDKHIKAP